MSDEENSTNEDEIETQTTEDGAQDNSETTPGSDEPPVDHMAAMAAAMEETNPENSESESTDDAVVENSDSATDSEEPQTDHMAAMAAAMDQIDPDNLESESTEDKNTSDATAADQTVETDTPVRRRADAESIAESVSHSDVNIDTLLKVPVSLSIEVGRTRMTINELLETQEGSVIELERHLEEPLDILVNGALIAHGVVVLANERFGLQITDIISPEERAKSI